MPWTFPIASRGDAPVSEQTTSQLCRMDGFPEDLLEDTSGPMHTVPRAS
jgi:hypothetical protein